MVVVQGLLVVASVFLERLMCLLGHALGVHEFRVEVVGEEDGLRRVRQRYLVSGQRLGRRVVSLDVVGR